MPCMTLLSRMGNGCSAKKMSRLNVMSHNQPSWVAEEPSKTGQSAVQGFGATRQKGAFCLF